MSEDHLTELAFVADLEKSTPSHDSVLISNRVLQGSAADVARLKAELREARERIQAILDWADLALNNPEHFKIGGVRNLTGPAFDAARAFLTKGETDGQ